MAKKKKYRERNLPEQTNVIPEVEDPFALPPGFTPTEDQATLCDLLLEWNQSGMTPKGKLQYFTYSGAPGTGKTTILKMIANKLGYTKYDILCMAFVGNAVLNLLKAGMNAKTYHSAIYRLKIYNIPVEDDDGNPVIDKKTGKQKIMQKMAFELNESLDRDYKLLVLDEGGMVPGNVIMDILSFGIPLLIVGDKKQLKPVMGTNPFMSNPHFTLRQIMRQAAGSPVVKFCQYIDQDLFIPYGDYDDDCHVVKSLPFGKNLLEDYDIIIVATNDMRMKLNNYIRHNVLGIPNDRKPHVGEKVICKSNKWDRAIQGFNLVTGMVGTITDYDAEYSTKKYFMIDFKPDIIDGTFFTVEMDREYWIDPESCKNKITDNCKFESGYVITTHLSQGSQFPRVLFIDENIGMKDFMKRERYTAISRAQKSVTILRPSLYGRVYFEDFIPKEDPFADNW